jgi:hypothetical protein
VAGGTSADAQLTVYRQARDKGADREEALAAVSEWLAETTLERSDFGQHLQAGTSYLHPAAAGAHTHSDQRVVHAPCLAATTAVQLERGLTADLPVASSVTAADCSLLGGPTPE